MYAEAKRSVFVCWKSFKKRDTFTELYSSTVSIVYFLILHFYAIKRFIPYNIYVRVKRTTFLKYFVSQFIVSYMPIDTYLRTNLNERILTWQYSQPGKKSIAYFLHPYTHLNNHLQGFIQAISMSGRRHKKLNLQIEFSNSIFIKFCFKGFWR